MDLMYLPDAFTFHVIRSPTYDARDYLDAAWEEEEERQRRQRRNSGGKGKKGKACTNSTATTTTIGAEARSGGGGSHHRKASGGGKDACPMCKERKRRTLATYIRTKSRQDSECTIEEEEEVEGEDGGVREGCSTKGLEGCSTKGLEECPAKAHECAS